MSYSVKQGDIFGRIGSGIGQGLSESLPKEIERGRLAQGLQDFERDSPNLSPMQSIARLAAIPGNTPQLIQTMGELAKLQNVRNAYGKGRKGTQDELTAAGPSNTAQSLGGINFAGGNLPDKGKSTPPRGLKPAVYENKPDIVPNPTRPGTELLPPWTPQQIDDRTFDYIESGKTLDPQVARGWALEDMQRERERPVIERQNDEYRQKVENDLEKEFDAQLGTILQKEGKEVYGDITGDLLLDLKEAARLDLINNPQANKKQVVKEWIKKAHDFSKAKSKLNSLAGRDIWDGLFKQGETHDKLRSAQKAYADFGKEEELYNILKTKTSLDTAGKRVVGFDMSPQTAAQEAFPRSPGVSKVIKTYQPHSYGSGPNAQRAANEVGRSLGDKDSLLAIAKDLKERDPMFNQNAFFNQIRDDLAANKIRLNPRQQNELIEGESAYTPSWGDFWWFPQFRGVKNK